MSDMGRAEELANKAYPKRGWKCKDSEGNDAFLDSNRERRLAFINGYEQAEKDFIEKAEKWLKSCLDNGCWVANDLGGIEKEAIILGFKQVMSE